MNIGDTVFVWWYGKPVQGVVVEKQEVTPMLSQMVVVRIPIQGVHASALFMPHNVFATEDLLLAKHKVFTPAEAKNKQFEVKVEAPAAVEHPDVGPSCSEVVSNLILQQAKTNLDVFKKSHWDNEHNHIRIDAINEFYDLWVDYMCTRTRAMKQPKKSEYHPEADAYDGGPKPDAYKQATQPIKRVVSDTKMESLKQQLKTKLKPKKRQVTYTQLSLWD